MAYKIFRLSAHGLDGGEVELNRFLAGGRIASVQKEFVAAGADSYWSFCVETVDGAESAGRKAVAAKVDYREVLSEADFAVFSSLRVIRKELAEKEAVPAYQIFTNEQLAQMVTMKVRDRAGLEKIAGVGAARLEKYAAPFLEALAGGSREAAE